MHHRASQGVRAVWVGEAQHVRPCTAFTRQIIIDANYREEHLPHSIEAFFYVKGCTGTEIVLGHTCQGRDVQSEVHQKFLAEYKLSPNDVPLLRLNPKNWHGPFEVPLEGEDEDDEPDQAAPATPDTQPVPVPPTPATPATPAEPATPATPATPVQQPAGAGVPTNPTLRDPQPPGTQGGNPGDDCWTACDMSPGKCFDDKAGKGFCGKKGEWSGSCCRLGAVGEQSSPDCGDRGCVMSHCCVIDTDSA
jgi:hypothetical protein